MAIPLFSAIWVLVYATAVMTLLLNVRPLKLTGAKRLVFWIALPCIFLFNFVAMELVGLKNFGVLYPLIGQLPVFVVFYAISNRGIIKSFFALLTTIFLTFPYTIISALIYVAFKPPVFVLIVIMVIISILLLLAIRHFMAANFAYMMDNIEAKETLKYCFVPLFYSILTYAIGKYTGGVAVLPFRCFLFANTLVVYFLLMNAIKSASHIQLLRHEKDMFFMQMQAAKQQFEQLKTTQEQAVLYRHDMRHHLSLVKGYIADGEMQKAEEYLTQAQADMDAITPVHYCENDTANMIFSSFAGKAKEKGVDMSIDVNLPQKLPISETDLCALFSNGLENAINAASKVDDVSLRKVSLNCRINENRLLIYMENNYTGAIVLENGLPKANCEGHGFGTKSMAFIAAKLNGYCACETNGNTFILRIVLPLT